MVHLALLLLASRAASSRALSLRVADSSAVSRCGDRRGWRFIVFEIDLFPSGANFARATRHLTNRLCLYQSNSRAVFRKLPVLAAK